MWSDREADQDFLGYSSYVAVLADICTHPELAPLTLGTFGSWGSGKTSLMKMLKARLDADAAKTKTKTLWFNAWRYEGRDEAQSALMHAVLAKLAEDRDLWEKAKDTFERLKKGVSVMKVAKVIGKSLLTLTPKVDELIDCFKEESEKLAETMEAFEKDFQGLLSQANISRIVVFIDDLDRCSSTKVIETFETIKLFLNSPSSTFVIGADAAKIEQAVGDVYKVTDARRQKDYLEKIVQIPFNIPEQDLRDIACYVGMLIVGRHLPAEQWPRLIGERPTFYKADSVEDAFYKWPVDNRAVFVAGSIDDVVAELKAIMPYAVSLGRGLRGNPRQIKRFLNILGLRRRLAAENALRIEPGVLVKLTVLEYVWPDFFNAVVENVDPQNGRSPLIEEVTKAADVSEKPSGSKLVSDALAQPGLVNYLLVEPKLDGTTDLSPYLFLAQTSLSRERLPGIVPIDEQARSLAAAIQSDDQLRSRMAAKRAAALDPAGASAVVRLLLADLAAAKDAMPRTHILNGLTEVCQKHRDHFAAVVRAMDQFDAAGQDAVAIAAGALLEEASRCGVAVAQELKERFTAASPLAAALAPRKGGGKPGRK
jgi:hypothetical protein